MCTSTAEARYGNTATVGPEYDVIKTSPLEVPLEECPAYMSTTAGSRGYVGDGEAEYEAVDRAL